MPGIARDGGKDVAGGPIIQGSGNVYADNFPVARIGDAVAGHGKPPHSGPVMAQGSPNVFTNEISTSREGDAASCGHTASGSNDVYVNDGGGPYPLDSIPQEYGVEAVAPLIAESGRYAAFDEEETSQNTPVEYPEDRPAFEGLGVPSAVSASPTATPALGPCGAPEVAEDSFQVSPNFTLGQYSTRAFFPHAIQAQNGFTVSEIICNIQALSNEVIEKINAQFPGVRINSGFRKTTGGKSQHERGMAADLQWPGISAAEYQSRAEWIINNLIFDQLIFEHGNSVWIHVSFDRTKSTQRKSILTMYKGSYTAGITNYYA